MHIAYIKKGGDTLKKIAKISSIDISTLFLLLALKDVSKRRNPHMVISCTALFTSGGQSEESHLKSRAAKAEMYRCPV